MKQKLGSSLDILEFAGLARKMEEKFEERKNLKKFTTEIDTTEEKLRKFTTEIDTTEEKLRKFTTEIDTTEKGS